MNVTSAPSALGGFTANVALEVVVSVASPVVTSVAVSSTVVASVVVALAPLLITAPEPPPLEVFLVVVSVLGKQLRRLRREHKQPFLQGMDPS